MQGGSEVGGFRTAGPDRRARPVGADRGGGRRAGGGACGLRAVRVGWRGRRRARVGRAAGRAFRRRPAPVPASSGRVGAAAAGETGRSWFVPAPPLRSALGTLLGFLETVGLALERDDLGVVR